MQWMPWDHLRRYWLVAALIIFFGAVFLQFTLKVSQADHSRSAFLRWQTQLADLDEGINVWDKYAYPNPPMMALILKPFMQLPPMIGSSLWFLCKAILACASILIVVSLLDEIRKGDAPEGGGGLVPSRHASSRFPAWAKVLAVALSLRPIEGDLMHGNVNLLILFLIVASLWALCRQRDGLAGVLLALSIACKLTPALFVPYLLWKRAWKALMGLGAGLIVLVFVIPALTYGWDSNLDYLHSWHQQMVAPYAAGVVSSEHKNQSLPGLLHRLLCDEPSFSEYSGVRKIVLDTHNLVALDPVIVQGLVAVSMGIFALAAAYFCRASMDDRLPISLMAEFSLVVLGMLLFCERTWKHHCVTLLLPFAVIAYGLATPSSNATRWLLAAILAAIGLLMLATSTGVYDHQSEAHDRIGKLAQVYGAYVWVFLLLIAGVCFVIPKIRSAHPGASELLTPDS
jgi:hypothetical protein